MPRTTANAKPFTVTILDGDSTLVGLARVSTDGQDAQLQLDALTEARVHRIFQEKISTRKAADDRAGLQAALDYVRSGDTLVVWKLDRLGRSAKELLTIADDLHKRGVTVKILTGTLNGSYAPKGEGKFFFTVLAALAELERDIIHERTMAGLAAARAQGRTGGRPPAMDDDKIAAAEARLRRGESPTQIARALGISVRTVYRHVDTTERAEPAPRKRTVAATRATR
jgi:DNA invertase Pin-like site-specific DNA recombinase